MISSTSRRTSSREISRLVSVLAGDAVVLVHQAEQEVLGPDLVVVEHPRLFLSEDDGAAGSIGEALEHLTCRIGLWAGRAARAL